MVIIRLTKIEIGIGKELIISIAQLDAIENLAI
jgi:hypothetical protein